MKLTVGHVFKIAKLQRFRDQILNLHIKTSTIEAELHSDGVEVEWADSDLRAENDHLRKVIADLDDAKWKVQEELDKLRSEMRTLKAAEAVRDVVLADAEVALIHDNKPIQAIKELRMRLGNVELLACKSVVDSYMEKNGLKKRF